MAGAMLQAFWSMLQLPEHVYRQPPISMPVEWHQISDRVCESLVHVEIASLRSSAGGQWAGGYSEGCRRTTVQASQKCSHKWVPESEPKLDCCWGRFLGFDGCEWIQTRQVQPLPRITCAGCSHPQTACLLLCCAVHLSSEFRSLPGHTLGEILLAFCCVAVCGSLIIFGLS